MSMQPAVSWRVAAVGDPGAGVAPAPVAAAPAPRAAGWGRAGSALGRISWILPVLCFLGLWELAADTGVVDKTLLTPPSEVAPALVRVVKSGQVFDDLGSSLARASIGFGIAAVGGVCLGLAIGWIRSLRRFISPIAELFRQLPPLALLPVFVLLLGLGLKSQVAMVAWAVAWPVLLSTVTGAATIDSRLIKAARSLGARGIPLFAKVALPGAMPSIVTGLRLGASYALLVLVSAEMIGASSGIGFRILEEGNTFHIPEMYAYIVVLAILGVGLNYLLLWANKALFPWMAQ